jgi:hypothetical protein
MKKFDLATCGVEEMSEAQMRNVDGGFWQAVAEVITSAVLGGFLTQDQNILQQYREAGFNTVRPMY